MATLRWRHGLLALAIVVAAVLTGTATASAHAALDSTSPSADTVLTTSPTQVVLTFSETVSTLPDSIRVVAADGSAVATGAVRQDLGKNTVAADVPQLADGTYVVAWKAISADSHPVNGAFSFSVGAPTPTKPGLVADLVAGERPDRGDEVWLAAGRAASYAALALLVGGYAITVICSPANLRRRRTGRLLWTAVGVGVAGTALMIAAQAAVTVHDWSGWRSVWQTPAGRWWFVRLALFAVAAVPIVLRRRYRPSGAWPAALVIGAVAFCAVVAAGGHATTGQDVPLGFIATLAHLLAMCTWVGGATVLVLTPLDELWPAAARFSPIALASVATLAVTGTINAWRQADSFAALRDSSYGRWLLVKLVAIVVIVSVASVSRWLTHHPITTGTAPVVASVGAAAAPTTTERALRRTVLAEALGMIAVFAFTAALVNSPPPRAAATNGPLSVDVVSDGRIAQLILDPPTTGGTVMHIFVTNATSTIEQPDEITVTATLPANHLGPIDIPVTPAGPGHVINNAADIPIAGRWTITITARYGDFEATTFTFDVDIR